MNLPRPGSYFVVSTGGVYMDAVKLGTWSVWDHCGVVVNDDLDMIEAEPGGARVGNLRDYVNQDLIFDEDTLTDEARGRIIARALAFKGRPYGWLDIIALALLAVHIRPRRLVEWAENPRTVICSALVAYAGGTDAPGWTCDRDSPAFVTPKDLARRILRREFPPLDTAKEVA